MKNLKQKISLLIAFFLLTNLAVFGQNSEKTKEHRIIFQLSTADTMAHKALMKQVKNIKSVAPNTKIDVVCHGLV
jgi:hypothetical protein